MLSDDYLFYCNVWYIIMTGIELYVIMVGTRADWLSKTSTTEVCVTLPPNFRQVRGYPHISGQKTRAVNIKICFLDTTTVYKM